MRAGLACGLPEATPLLRPLPARAAHMARPRLRLAAPQRTIALVSECAEFSGFPRSLVLFCMFWTVIRGDVGDEAQLQLLLVL